MNLAIDSGLYSRGHDRYTGKGKIVEVGEWLALMPYAALGGLLGVVHFGGLWWTVRRLAEVKRPALWMGGSFFLRTALVVFAFYWIVRAGWPATVTALAGFIVVRLLFGNRLRVDRR